MTATTPATPGAPLDHTPAASEREVRLGRGIHIFAWLSFLAEVIIIGTGGAVRLTGSGLGCTEWPLCTPESLVPLPEQGIHGVIEFGNRTMTGLVGILALAVLFFTLAAVGGRALTMRAVWFALGGIALGVVAGIATAPAGLAAFGFSASLLLAVIIAAVDSVRRARARRDLLVLAWIVLAGVMAQAVVGGLAVLTSLNAFVVGFHYTSSLLLVCVTAAYLERLYSASGTRVRVVPTWFAIGTHITGLALALTIVFGVLTTGSGPHSGDENIYRDGFDATVLAHVHAWPGYILLALVVLLAAAALVLRLPVGRWLLVLLAVIAVQITVGIVQARNGLPEVLVGIHMVLAALSAAAYTVVVLRLKRVPPSAPLTRAS